MSNLFTAVIPTRKRFSPQLAAARKTMDLPRLDGELWEHFLGLLPIEWVLFRPFDAFWKMEVIHSPAAASFNLRVRCGAVDNFLTF